MFLKANSEFYLRNCTFFTSRVHFHSPIHSPA